MSGLFTGCSFPSFGSCKLFPQAELPAAHVVNAPRTSRLRTEVKLRCPRRPGIYGMLSDKGELLYVGKAKCLRTRLLSYFRVKGRDPKAGRIIRHAQGIAWEHAPSEFAALVRELELIRKWRPRFNVIGQPGRRQPVYVCLGRTPAPHLFVTRRPPAGLMACWGPLGSSWRVRLASRYLNDLFQLRDCPQPQEMVFSDQLEMFEAQRAAGCIRHEIGSCLAPCAAACSRREYSKNVRAAQAFLAGGDDSLLGVIQARMEAASNAMAFEQAATLRDRLETLRWLQQCLDRLRRLRRKQSFVYPVRGVDHECIWYLIDQGRVVAAFPAPRQGEADETAQLLERVYGLDGKVPLVGSVNELDSVLLVAEWFTRHPDEKARLLPPHEAAAFCRANVTRR